MLFCYRFTIAPLNLHISLTFRRRQAILQRAVLPAPLANVIVMAPRKERSPRAAQNQDGRDPHGFAHSFMNFDYGTYFATRRRQFLTLSVPVRVIVILLPVMALYITALYLKDHWLQRQSAPRTTARPAIGPPQLWLLDTTTPYHITADINNFCSYHSFGPLVQSSLPPLALPNTGSSPASKNGRQSAAPSLTSGKAPSPDYDDQNPSRGIAPAPTDDNVFHPFTLHHHGHLVLGYGTIRLRIFSDPYDWQTPDQYRTHPSSYNTLLTNVLHVPNVPEQVISLSKLLSDDAHDASGYIEHSRTDAGEMTLRYHGNPGFHAWAKGGVYVLEAKSWVSDQGDCNNTSPSRPKFAV